MPFLVLASLIPFMLIMAFWASVITFIATFWPFILGFIAIMLVFKADSRAGGVLLAFAAISLLLYAGWSEFRSSNYFEEHREDVSTVYETRTHIATISINFVASVAGNVNVREFPDRDSKIIGTLKPNSAVNVVAEVQGKNWYQIKIGRVDGFVYGPLLMKWK